MADALGYPVFGVSGRATNWLVYLQGTLAWALCLPARLSNMSSFLLFHVCYAREQRRVMMEIQTGRYPACNRFVEAFGLSETMGHLWVIVNGSSLPESSIVCDIVAELAGNETEQERVLHMVQQGHDSELTAWIRERLQKFVYFDRQNKTLSRDVEFDGVHLAAGQVMKVNLKWLNDNYDELYTMGFGQRRCPGAAIGAASIQHWIAHIVRNYRIGVPPRDLIFRLTSLCRCLDPYGVWSMGGAYLGRATFNVIRRD